MPEAPSFRVLDLLDRLCRVLASENRSDTLNSAQHAALAYLARANRFSRSPSHVADYLCTTRGTASQTLKSLEAKGLIEKAAIADDRRSIAYEVTETGRESLRGPDGIAAAIDRVKEARSERFGDTLAAVLAERLKDGGFRSFGICRTCRYHQQQSGRRHCGLLNLDLQDDEAGQLCHEHVAA